jgi:hypothetical protein
VCSGRAGRTKLSDKLVLPSFGFSPSRRAPLTLTVETVEKPFASKNREKISHFGLKNAEFLLEKTKNRAIFDNFFPLCPVQFLRMDFFNSLVGTPLAELA